MAEAKTGITINFRGNTIEFDRSIDGVNKALQLLSSQAKSLKNDLKLGGDDTWEKQQKLIEINTSKMELLREKIELYKESMATLQDKQNNGINLTKKENTQLANLGKALEKAERELKNLEKANQDLEKSMPDFVKWTKQLDEFSKGLDGVANSLEQIGKQFTVISAAAASALTVGVKYNAEMEQYTIALTTALGNEEKALETIEQIKKDAEKTPWGVKELVEYNRTLIATGLSAEESEDIILSLGDAVSAVGGTSDVFSRMVQNLQQIKNAGNATAMDIRQFANAGIDIYGILADYLGKTTDQISEQDRTWENIIGAFKKANSEGGKYFGAMANQSESLTSQLNKLKDEVSQALGEITESLMPTIKKVVSYIKDLAKKLKALSPSQKEALANVLAITAAIAPLLLGLGKLIKSISSFTKGLSTFVKVVNGGSVQVTSFSSVMGNLVKVIGSNLPIALGIAGAAISAYGIYTALANNKTTQFRDEMQSLADTANTTYAESMKNIISENKNVSTILDEVKANLSTLDYNPNGTIDKTSVSYGNLSQALESYHSYIGDSDYSIDREIEKLTNNEMSVDDLKTSYEELRIEKQRQAWLEANQESYNTALQEQNSLAGELVDLQTQINDQKSHFLENNYFTEQDLDMYEKVSKNLMSVEEWAEEAGVDLQTASDTYNDLATAIQTGTNLVSLYDQYRVINDLYKEATSIVEQYNSIETAPLEEVVGLINSITGEAKNIVVNYDKTSIDSCKTALSEVEKKIEACQGLAEEGIDTSVWQETLLKQKEEIENELIDLENQSNSTSVVFKTNAEEEQKAQQNVTEEIYATSKNLEEAETKVKILENSLNGLSTYKRVDIDVFTNFKTTGSATSYSSSYGGSGGYGSGGFIDNLKSLVKNIKLPNYSFNEVQRNFKNGMKLANTQLASGGFNAGGFNFTLNVNNNGKAISSDSVKQWADIITDRINENLGKEL